MPKTKTEKQIRKEFVGKIKVLEVLILKPKKKTTFRTICRSSAVPKSKQRKSWATWDEAVAFASKLNQAILTGKVNDLDDEKLFKLREVYERFQTSKVLEQRNLNWSRNNTFEDVVDTGIKFLALTEQLNDERLRAGLGRKTLPYFLGDFESHNNIQVQKSKLPSFEKAIGNFLEYKLSPNGGKGNVPLQHKARTEWSRIMGILSNWVGENSIDRGEILYSFITNKISQLQGNDGAATPLTKHRYAEKIKEFGSWLVRQKLWNRNEFSELPIDFAFTKKSLPKVLKPGQVKKLFTVAQTKEEWIKLIPYMSFLFFAGARPEELAAGSEKPREQDKKNHRFNWGLVDWEFDSKVTGGIIYNQPIFEDGVQISKGARDRKPEFSACGVAWMRWWAEKCNGDKLPTSGRMYFQRRPWSALRKAAEVEWSHDVARHSFTSYAHHNGNWDVVEDYWLRKCGHTADTYKKYYENQQSQKDCEAYFSITPLEKNNPAD